MHLLCKGGVLALLLVLGFIVLIIILRRYRHNENYMVPYKRLNDRNAVNVGANGPNAAANGVGAVKQDVQDDDYDHLYENDDYK